MSRLEDSSTSVDPLRRCGNWLLSLSRNDILELRRRHEYQAFISAFERLMRLHQNEIVGHDSYDSIASETKSTKIGVRGDEATPGNSQSLETSFLQHLADDDVLLLIFDFLESQSLVRVSISCTRLHELGHKNANKRTSEVAEARQLNHVMKLLRAKEQIDGVGTNVLDKHVKVPLLLPRRRIIVSDAGDPDYCGVYFCTGSNGNGFVFTKPREPEQRILTTPTTSFSIERNVDAGESERPERLQCIIAKRFSNETILWYMSKEIISTGGVAARVSNVTQQFSYWAKLMVVGDASPDLCRYPSQSSILSSHGEGWQTLPTTASLQPPVVELLD